MWLWLDYLSAFAEILSAVSADALKPCLSDLLGTKWVVLVGQIVGAMAAPALYAFGKPYRLHPENGEFSHSLLLARKAEVQVEKLSDNPHEKQRAEIRTF